MQYKAIGGDGPTELVLGILDRTQQFLDQARTSRSSTDFKLDPSLFLTIVDPVMKNLSMFRWQDKGFSADRFMRSTKGERTIKVNVVNNTVKAILRSKSNQGLMVMDGTWRLFHE